MINILLLLLSASPVRGRHNRFPTPFVPIFCILLRHFNHYHVLSHRIQIPPLLAFIVSSFLAVQSSASLSQYTHNLSSVHVQTTSVLTSVLSLSRPKSVVPLMYSFLILSICVPLNENRNIFNSATSINSISLFL